MSKLSSSLSYLRSYIISLFFGFWTLLIAAVVVFMAAVLGIGRRGLDRVIVWLWALPMLKFSGVKVDVRGRERVTARQKGFLILFNHSSLIDIPILYAYFPRMFSFGAKIELFKIPFFGRAMELCGVLPIDRSNRNKVMKIYQDAIARVNGGESFALAPEGTRQNEPRLGKFKRGPFEFAVNAQMDIVPVVLAGAFYVLPRSSVWINSGKWSRKVLMEILPPVSTEGMTLEQLENLLEIIRQQMEETFSRLTRELEASSTTPLS